MAEAEAYNDLQLFEQISESNEQSFTLFFHRYVPRLLPFISKITKDQSLSESIIQETFLKLWLGRDKLAEVENPAAWVHRIAANECYRTLRRQMLSASLTGPNDITDYLQETIHLRELSRLIKEAVETLPEQRRKIYVLSRESGMTIPQIAEVLNLSPNTVKNTLVTSLKTIRAFLEKRGYALPVVLLVFIL